MPPFNYHEEPLKLLLSTDDGQTYETFTGLKDVAIKTNNDPEPHPDWVCCPYDCGFSATITLTNKTRRTIKKWDKAIKKYLNCLNRRKRIAKRIKEQRRRFEWRVCKGKPPKDFWERYWRGEYGK